MTDAERDARRFNIQAVIIGFVVVVGAILFLHHLNTKNEAKTVVQETIKRELLVDLCPGMPIPQFFVYPNSYGFAIQYVNNSGDLVLTTTNSDLTIRDQAIFPGDLCNASR